MKYQATSEVIPPTEKYVLGGGSLLHELKWTRRNTYCKISTGYGGFTSKYYGSGTVVFDGHLSGLSNKENTHQRPEQTTIYPIVRQNCKGRKTNSYQGQ